MEECKNLGNSMLINKTKEYRFQYIHEEYLVVNGSVIELNVSGLLFNNLAKIFNFTVLILAVINNYKNIKRRANPSVPLWTLKQKLIVRIILTVVIILSYGVILIYISMEYYKLSANIHECVNCNIGRDSDDLYLKNQEGNRMYEIKSYFKCNSNKVYLSVVIITIYVTLAIPYIEWEIEYQMSDTHKNILKKCEDNNNEDRVDSDNQSRSSSIGSEDYQVMNNDSEVSSDLDK
jgi:hypothetical protein